MNKAILTLLAMGFLAVSQCHASRPNTYEVDDRGSVSVGAAKLGSINSKVNDFQSRKPESREITDTDHRQMKTNSSFFSW